MRKTTAALIAILFALAASSRGAILNVWEGSDKVWRWWVLGIIVVFLGFVILWTIKPIVWEKGNKFVF